MKIDLKPTKKKIIFSLLISLTILMIIVILLTLNKKTPTEVMSPQEFRMIYVTPILIFLTTYFAVCWYVTHEHNESIEWPIKH